MARPAAFSVAALALFAAACAPTPSEPPRKNVVLISIDSLRADHLGCYGYGPPTSPRIDALAKDGTLFRWAYAPSPWTLPSHVSLFTGLEPAAHGVDHGQARLGEHATTLADLLRERGYRTGAVLCSPLFRKKFGMDQGFDVYDMDLIGKDYLEARLSKLADKVTDKALAFVDANGDRPFFLFLHYWDPHYDYNPTKEYLDLFDPDYRGTVDGLNIHDRTDFASGLAPRDLAHLVALYDAEIRFTDDELGRLFDGLKQRGRDEDTAVIVTSDHGEEFLEHGGTGHTHTCFEEVLRIPLIVRVPWLARGASVLDGHASLLDLFPTILDLVGAPRDGVAVQGTSLAGVLAGTGAIPARFLMAETRMGQLGQAHGNMSSLLAPDRMKYIQFQSAESRQFLFDLNRDPGERSDLAAGLEAAAASLSGRLSAGHVENRRWNEAIRVGREEELEPELSETLKGLGYVQ